MTKKAKKTMVMEKEKASIKRHLFKKEKRKNVSLFLF
jgi:hypothetical protein